MGSLKKIFKVSVFTEKSEKISVHYLNTRTFLVGRSRSCDVVLKNPKASGKHFMVSYIKQALWISDDGSRNGTFIRGGRIPIGYFCPYTSDGHVFLGKRGDTSLKIDVLSMSEEEYQKKLEHPHPVFEESLKSPPQKSHFKGRGFFESDREKEAFLKSVDDYPIVNLKRGSDREETRASELYFHRLNFASPADDDKGILHLEAQLLGLSRPIWYNIGEKCTIGLDPQLDFSIKDFSVAPRHATFYREDEDRNFLVIHSHDKKSTFMDRDLMPEKRYLVENDQTFTLGDVEFFLGTDIQLRLQTLTVKHSSSP